ncbi:RNA polymerase sigma factor SigJ [Actinomarinicola tropica]|uniref:Sigma-70 family RNA polymerase sigma factor n=1 Tax=Actinomarinicola tropica TaxID=2789776 RepID=A0A5Q2RM59_9ACTN|nr:RNA polymerase sigma factor SigJ [Actinomarinicola tropica]QGG94275.1 sigma-70 family RNA polymerase sigma factor [Actinomarinicola tropica]
MNVEVDEARLRAVAVGVAYRMLGSRTDAEDLAQDALVRFLRATTREPARNAEALVTTITTRLALDHLRSARVARETYIGPWLPEPVVDDPLRDPDRAAELAASVSFAMLVVLDSLSPAERAAFVLHDVFGWGYRELTTTLDRSEAACRQLVSRARRSLAANHGQGGVRADPEEHEVLLDRFLRAARGGDVDGLLELLAPDAVLVSDGGADVRAARHPIVGLERIARFLRRVGPAALGAGTIERARLNGEPGFVVRTPTGTHLAGTIEVHGGRITAIRWVLNRSKLRWVDT